MEKSFRIISYWSCSNYKEKEVKGDTLKTICICRNISAIGIDFLKLEKCLNCTLVHIHGTLEKFGFLEEEGRTKEENSFLFCTFPFTTRKSCFPIKHPCLLSQFTNEKSGRVFFSKVGSILPGPQSSGFNLPWPQYPRPQFTWPQFAGHQIQRRPARIALLWRYYFLCQCSPNALE